MDSPYEQLQQISNMMKHNPELTEAQALLTSVFLHSKDSQISGKRQKCKKNFPEQNKMQGVMMLSDII